MCGRYFQYRDIGQVAEHFEAVPPLPNIAPSWNVAPTQDAPVLRRHPESGARHLGSLRWGLVPRWARDASGGARLMNARAESVAEKPSFRDAFARRRCLVPADGFYEWRTEGKAKQTYAVALRDGAPMALAGLWEGWKSPEGEWLRSFSIITTEANAKQALVHHRMPVILPREDWPAWLGEAEAAPEALLDLLRPCPPEWLSCWPVDNRVGRVAENDPALLGRDPLATPPPELDDPPVVQEPR
ncbi:SOS response-associated peptidase [Teichococcus oryzae]|uniref:Abasic site processing protein n=1 Tax=Teichococcus oryzae TaxID=1608942 RepID=A0A5B2TER5_9PROT|nr:SOS response-associated peptidase [Pseudoroseomonas oryzae]KAA2212659.1 SOS response-associated peptidase [Pseudoroseomonas oryzae]